MSTGVGTDGSKKWRIIYCRLRRSARKRRWARAAYAAKKFGFVSSLGFEALRDRAIE